MPNTIVVTREEPIAVVQLNRPDVLNALNEELMGELLDALRALDDDEAIRCIVLTGSDKAFAAGADIKETFVTATPVTMLAQDLTTKWEGIRKIKKPIIAAVSGYALGGGCELALTADLRIAAADARFGQPEILLGLIPGAGGTQRLTRLVGPAIAKDLIYTGRMVDATEALAIRLVNRVVPAADTYGEAVALAQRLARGPAYALRAAKEAIDRGLETDLDTGLEIERIQFAALFATEDRTIGMRSFVADGPGKARFTGT